MEALSITAIVISLCVLILTLYEGILTRKSFREQTYQGFVGTWFQLDKIFIDFPELREYFYHNRPLEENDDNYHRIMAISELFDDCFTYTESQTECVPKNLVGSYQAYKDRIRNMKAFGKYKNEYGDWVNSAQEKKKCALFSVRRTS